MENYSLTSKFLPSIHEHSVFVELFGKWLSASHESITQHVNLNVQVLCFREKFGNQFIVVKQQFIVVKLCISVTVTFQSSSKNAICYLFKMTGLYSM